MEPGSGLSNRDGTSEGPRTTKPPLLTHDVYFCNFQQTIKAAIILSTHTDANVGAKRADDIAALIKGFSNGKNVASVVGTSLKYYEPGW